MYISEAQAGCVGDMVGLGEPNVVDRRLGVVLVQFSFKLAVSGSLSDWTAAVLNCHFHYISIVIMAGGGVQAVICIDGLTHNGTLVSLSYARNLHIRSSDSEFTPQTKICF